MSELIVCSPPLDADRLAVIVRAAAEVDGDAVVVNRIDDDRVAVFRGGQPTTPQPVSGILSAATGWIGKPTDADLQAAKQLRWLQSPTASLEHFLTPAIVDHSVVLTNCRGLFGDVVAEHVFGLLLTMSRNLHQYRDRQHDRRFEPVGSISGSGLPDFATGPAVATPVDRCHHRLQDWSLLVVGVGGIGSAIATRAAAWGIRVHGVDRDRRTLTGVLPSIDPPGRLPEIIGRFDVVIVTLPLTPATDGLFDAPMIGRMKRGSRLVNVGRGGVVSTAAVVQALLTGHLAAVGLDVFDDEPLPPEHPLWGEANAILTPHVAASSSVIAERHLKLLVDNVQRFLSGRPLRNVVDKTAGY